MRVVAVALGVIVVIVGLVAVVPITHRVVVLLVAMFTMAVVPVALRVVVRRGVVLRARVPVVVVRLLAIHQRLGGLRVFERGHGLLLGHGLALLLQHVRGVAGEHQGRRLVVGHACFELGALGLTVWTRTTVF